MSGLWAQDSPWMVVPKFTPAAARLADGHYSRRTVGSPQFMPPGQTLVLITPDERAVFGWWRPDPASGLEAMNGLDGWTCTIFRNTGTQLSSDLILAAERELLERYDCGPDGLITYVWDSKVRSANPGYCFKVAGWRVTGRSADGKKTLLQKPVPHPRPATPAPIPLEGTGHASESRTPGALPGLPALTSSGERDAARAAGGAPDRRSLRGYR